MADLSLDSDTSYCHDLAHARRPVQPRRPRPPRRGHAAHRALLRGPGAAAVAGGRRTRDALRRGAPRAPADHPPAPAGPPAARGDPGAARAPATTTRSSPRARSRDAGPGRRADRGRRARLRPRADGPVGRQAHGRRRTRPPAAATAAGVAAEAHRAAAARLGAARASPAPAGARDLGHGRSRRRPRCRPGRRPAADGPNHSRTAPPGSASSSPRTSSSTSAAPSTAAPTSGVDQLERIARELFEDDLLTRKEPRHDRHPRQTASLDPSLIVRPDRHLIRAERPQRALPARRGRRAHRRPRPARSAAARQPRVRPRPLGLDGRARQADARQAGDARGDRTGSTPRTASRSSTYDDQVEVVMPGDRRVRRGPPRGRRELAPDRAPRQHQPPRAAG